MRWFSILMFVFPEAVMARSSCLSIPSLAHRMKGMSRYCHSGPVKRLFAEFSSVESSGFLELQVETPKCLRKKHPISQIPASYAGQCGAFHWIISPRIRANTFLSNISTCKPVTSWWLNQPIWKILVKMGIFPNLRGENTKCLKPPAR